MLSNHDGHRSPEYLYPTRGQAYARVASLDTGGYELSHIESYSGDHSAFSVPATPEASAAASIHSTVPLTLDYDAYRGLQSERQSTSSKRNPWNVIRACGDRFDRWQRTNRYSGWRLGVLSGLIISVLVLLMNIILLIVGLTQPNGYADGVATLHEGSAARIGKLSTMYHVLINVLSTLLLTASNYTMQVLCSPTREEVDKAHAKGRFLNIGILSSKNVRYISKRRLLLWWTLAVSSVPLHLFYNAAIFKVTTGNEYSVNFVSDMNTTQVLALNQTMHNMSNSVWSETYGLQYVSEYNDLYFIVDQISFSLKYLATQGGNLTGNITSTPSPIYVSYKNGSLLDSLLLSPGDWYAPSWSGPRGRSGQYKYQMSVNDSYNIDHTYHIQYAFANPVKDVNATSKVQIGLVFMVIVIVCNFTKSLTLLIAFMDNNTSYLVTQGDALASFLARPDPITIACCLTSYDKIESRVKQLRHSNGSIEHSTFDGEIWHKKRKKLQDGLSSLRGGITIGLAVLVITAGCTFLSIQGFRFNGWGPASPTTFTFASEKFDITAILLLAAVANAPQLVLSMIYITVNGVLTCIAMAIEWNTWGAVRKGLRVTKPEGLQRSTHFLQLPYKIAVPLTVISGVLHWLLSETIFLVRVDIIDHDGNRVSADSISACGYSMSSFLAFSLVAVALFIGIASFTWRSLEEQIPFAAANSLIISAACHPPEGDTNAHLKEVQWGAVPSFGIEDEYTIGHCTFSSGDVKPPMKGKRYL